MSADAVWSTVEQFRARVEGLADVTEDSSSPVRRAEFRPVNPEGARVRVWVTEAQLIVILGEASRFELGLDPVDQRLLAELLEAAESGGVREVTDMFGTAYTVQLADGSELPGRVVQIRWRGRSSRDYAAWRSSPTFRLRSSLSSRT